MENRSKLTRLVIWTRLVVFFVGVVFSIHSLAAEPPSGCEGLRRYDAPPVRLEDLDENWRYKKDADKLPVLRDQVNQRQWVEHTGRPYGSPQCKAILADLKRGRHFHVLEPQVRALSENDPAIQPWMTCSNSTRWDGVVPKAWERPFFGIMGLPPFLVYQVKSGPKAKKEIPVVLYREAGNNFSHTYDAVDMETCEIIDRAPVSSFGTCAKLANSPVAISLLATHNGYPMVISYIPWYEHERVTLFIHSISSEKSMLCEWNASNQRSNRN